MQQLELVQKIRDYIKDCYKADYVGLLEVDKTDSIYKFSIGIPSYMSPTTIGIDCDTDEEFLEYIYKELRTRNYMRLDKYKVIRTNDSREE